MAKKIAEAGIELIPNINDQRIKSAVSRIDKITASANSGINRIASSRGGMLGIGGSALGLIFNPLTLAVGAVVGVFTTLIGSTKKLNDKFKAMENQLTDEAQRQRKAFALMGGDTEDNQALYNVLQSQGVDTAGVYSNINERVSRGDLQQYKGLDKNTIITNLVDQARSYGTTDGKKYLEEMGLGELENLLYTNQSLSQLKNEAQKQSGNDFLNNNYLNNSSKADRLDIAKQLSTSNQEAFITEKTLQERIKEITRQTDQDNKLYNSLATQIAITNGHLDKLNKETLSKVIDGLYSILRWFGVIKDERSIQVKKEVAQARTQQAKNSSYLASQTNGKNIDNNPKD